MLEKIWESKSLDTHRTTLYFQTYWKFYTFELQTNFKQIEGEEITVCAQISKVKVLFFSLY